MDEVRRRRSSSSGCTTRCATAASTTNAGWRGGAITGVRASSGACRGSRCSAGADSRTTCAGRGIGRRGRRRADLFGVKVARAMGIFRVQHGRSRQPHATADTARVHLVPYFDRLTHRYFNDDARHRVRVQRVGLARRRLHQPRFHQRHHKHPLVTTDGSVNNTREPPEAVLAGAQSSRHRFLQGVDVDHIRRRLDVGGGVSSHRRIGRGKWCIGLRTLGAGWRLGGQGLRSGRRARYG